MFFYVHYTSSKTGDGISELRNHLLYRMAAKYYMEQPDDKETWITLYFDLTNVHNWYNHFKDQLL